MENKVSQVREHVLGQLESGRLNAGDKLPGAREIARQVKVSFAKAQQSLDLLVKDGILESFSRKGTFVQRNWAERILQHNISLFAPEVCLPWGPSLGGNLRDAYLTLGWRLGSPRPFLRSAPRCTHRRSATHIWI